ncbi:DeoR/GlpR family DNA-binding transcription regulator [Erwinia billingiae]|uniref:DeoR/GlpR family DNA-binding transcription regulator n=1 Tax=Erwiniaceae TaxID=1903409 RepID=UPI00055BD9A9|nr:DeoR/GlpR family DNA-binding transcription regulator [Pantoea sp. YR343]KAJ9431831.1 DeoR/GlpR family DNA-binding transcription regulator [Pantoea sp. YR343]
MKAVMNTAEERQKKIVELLQEELFLDITTLTRRMSVSVATIRRDLDELEQAGLLRRTHGGAVSVNQVAQDPTHATRAVSRLPQKAGIAAEAVRMIAEGDAVLLDAGTTTLEIAKLLAERKDLTVISNGLDIINEMTRAERQNFYSVGGEFTDANRSFRGPLAENFIRQFNVDKLFLNAASVDLERGLICTTTPLNASVEKAMIEVSSRVIVVADYSKFTKSSLSVTTQIDDVDVIITDKGAQGFLEKVPDKWRRKFVTATPARN